MSRSRLLKKRAISSPFVTLACLRCSVQVVVVVCPNQFYSSLKPPAVVSDLLVGFRSCLLSLQFLSSSHFSFFPRHSDRPPTLFMFSSFALSFAHKRLSCCSLSSSFFPSSLLLLLLIKLLPLSRALPHNQIHTAN